MLIVCNNMCFKYLDTEKKQDDVILPPPLIPMKVVSDDFEDVDKELEEELQNMNFDDIESTVSNSNTNLYHI